MSGKGELPDKGYMEQTIRRLYLEDRHSDQEIADFLGIDRKTVTRWRRRWGINRQDRPAVAL